MKKIFFAVIVGSIFTLTNLSAVPPTPPPNAWTTEGVMTAPYSNGVNVTVMIVPGPENGMAVAAWADVNTLAPSYAIYDNGWSADPFGPIPLGDSTRVTLDVFVASPASGQLIFSWKDMGSQNPYYSLFDGNTWTTGVITEASFAIGNVSILAGPNAGEAIAIWVDADTNTIYSSVYSGGTWNLEQVSDNWGTENVFISQGPSAGTLIATWVDLTAHTPFYALYSNGAWGAAAQIDASEVFSDVTVTVGPNNGEVVAAWVSATSENYYSIYSNGNWTTGTIPLGETTPADQNIFMTQLGSGGLIATWVNNSREGTIYYSTYRNGVWSDADTLPLFASNGANRNVTVTTTLNGNTLLAAWGDFDNFNFFFSFVNVAPALLPPTNGTGVHVKNRFPLVVEWYNQLKWTASVTPGVVGYNIRRNGVLIAKSVPGTTYIDHNRPQDGTSVYRVTSVLADGTESATALKIIVR